MDKLTPQNAQQEHMVQILLAKMQGVAVEYYDVIDRRWETVSHKTIYLEFDYRIKSHELPITREMWAMIDKKWKWAAKDENDRIYFYTDEPYVFGNDNYWCVRGGRCIKSILAINADGIDWRKSLTKRPDGV